MLLRILSFVPAAWAVYVAVLLERLNRDPHPTFAIHAIPIALVALTLLLAVPNRLIRIATTLVLFVFCSRNVFDSSEKIVG